MKMRFGTNPHIAVVHKHLGNNAGMVGLPKYLVQLIKSTD
jgi:hypothetical protein